MLLHPADRRDGGDVTCLNLVLCRRNFCHPIPRFVVLGCDYPPPPLPVFSCALACAWCGFPPALFQIASIAQGKEEWRCDYCQKCTGCGKGNEDEMKKGGSPLVCVERGKVHHAHLDAAEGSEPGPRAHEKVRVWENDAWEQESFVASVWPLCLLAAGSNQLYSSVYSVRIRVSAQPVGRISRA